MKGKGNKHAKDLKNRKIFKKNTKLNFIQVFSQFKDSSEGEIVLINLCMIYLKEKTYF